MGVNGPESGWPAIECHDPQALYQLGRVDPKCTTKPIDVSSADMEVAGSKENGDDPGKPTGATPRSPIREPITEDQSTLRRRSGRAPVINTSEILDGPSQPKKGSAKLDTYLTDHIDGGRARGAANAENRDPMIKDEVRSEVETRISPDQSPSNAGFTYYHEGGDLAAEAFEGVLAVIPKVPISTTEEVKIEHICVRDTRFKDQRFKSFSSETLPKRSTDSLRKIMCRRHLLIGKGNASPPGCPRSSLRYRRRAISAFISPFGMFEWTRMQFGLKNAPQIYQQLLDNARYGFTRITRSKAGETPADVFEIWEVGDPGRQSVLRRRSDIDDILVTGGSFDQMCDRVEVC
ncbi:unnamed protein product [Phytophthora fragariaefolia]|uniref:Unnamed protein product n=1 Tax=Phytophthora fragariaefolia TaxID=1490495 RepID=A0A9W6YAF8_9STRA|nr:unnamed protein product [Phytophthora fragariaefolia]